MAKFMKSKIIKTIKNPKRAVYLFSLIIMKELIKFVYNPLIDFKKKFVKSEISKFKEVEEKFTPYKLALWQEIKKRSEKRTEICDHLPVLFIESLKIKPKLIVELGVKRGESTFVLERVAKLSNSKIVSCDIADCSGASSFKDWLFFQGDDIEFAEEFESWCEARKIRPKIDVLFIDTSHIYEHTSEEIKHWFPFLSEKSKVFFHDTNLRNKVYFRKDGSMGLGWDNKRGVIRALERFFNKSFDETKSFIDSGKGFLIKHYPLCNGFTILEKIKS